MRDLIITENITLDGVIDAAEGWFAPAGDEDVDQSDIIAALAEQREAADAFLVGRTTFEEMRGYWPHQTDDPTGITDYLNRVSKYVHPVVLGQGRRLFGDATGVPELKLVDTQRFNSGIVLLRYRPSRARGSLAVGSLRS